MNRKGVMPSIPQYNDNSSDHSAAAPTLRGNLVVEPTLAKQSKLFAPKAVLFMALWYVTSLITLFMNKYILSGLQGNPQTLAVAQMTTTCVMGAGKVRGCPLRLVAAPHAVMPSRSSLCAAGIRRVHRCGGAAAVWLQ